MAVLDKMPPKGTIGTLRGVLDFYSNQGRTIVRRWPNKRTNPVTPQEWKALYQSWVLNRLYTRHGPCARDLYASLVRGTNWAWKDQAYRMYFGKTPDLYGNPYTGPHFMAPDDPHYPPHYYHVYRVEVFFENARPRVRFYHDLPFITHRIVSGSRPPTLHPVHKVVRGQTIHCGYDLQLKPWYGGAFCPSSLAELGSTTITWNRLPPDRICYVQLSPYDPTPPYRAVASRSPVFRIYLHWWRAIGQLPSGRLDVTLLRLSPTPASLEFSLTDPDAVRRSAYYTSACPTAEAPWLPF